jgi:nitroimidazol reductase NimA-like FMN-containing flavoprotein (pyridoxamine 5'-phosphate oxidase superfamily)
LQATLAKTKGETRQKEGHMSPDTTLEEIGEEECLELLAPQSVGRLAVVHDGQPLVFPSAYFLDGRTVAIHTGLDVLRDAATLGKVAFEVDSVQPAWHQGWSVVVLGVGEHITDALDAWSERLMTRARQLPWAPGSESWVAISSPTFWGRRTRALATSRL